MWSMKPWLRPAKRCAPTVSGLRPGWMLLGPVTSTWRFMRRGRPIRKFAWSITTGALNRARPRMTAFLREIEARGLRILITELDVEDPGGPSDIAARDRAVADEARRFLDVVLA